jgi:serpin B
MAGAYAGTAGDTARQLAQVLRFTLPPDKLGPAFADLLAKLNGPPVRAAEPRAYQLVLAGSLWRQKGLGLNPEFIQRLRAGFGTDVNTADFAQAEPTRKALNDWAARQTKDRIKDLAPAGALSAQARLVLAGAACFHSGWQEKFPKDETQDGPFQVSADQSARVMLMHLRKRFDYAQSDGLQMLELPYAGGELSMLLFLPRKADGLAEMEQGLSGGTIDQWIRDKRSSAVDVTLPRFSLAGEFVLAGTIKDMGVTDVFDPDRADLSAMGVGGKGWVSQVVHKAMVSVDEEGTDALPPAAERAGSAEMIRLDNPKVFRADHPFVFVVRHNATGQILFMGRVANPKGT